MFLVTRRKIEIHISRAFSIFFSLSPSSHLPRLPISADLVALIIFFFHHRKWRRAETVFALACENGNKIFYSFLKWSYDNIFPSRLLPSQRERKPVRLKILRHVRIKRKSLACLPDYRGRVWRAWRRTGWPRDSTRASAPPPPGKR